MKKIMLAILVLNSLTVFAGELGQKEETQCPASTQSGRNAGLQKTVKEKSTESHGKEATVR